MATVHIINPLPETKKSKFKILKIFFQTLHILNGLDFGFSEKSNIFFWKFVTFVHAFFLCYVFTQIEQVYTNLYVAIWIFLTWLHYILTVLCLTLMKHKKLSTFFTDLETIDIELKVKSETLHLEAKILVVCLFHIVSRVTAIVIMVIFTKEQVINPAQYGCFLLWLNTSLLFVHISYAFMFYAVNYRLKKLDEVLKTATFEFSSLQRTYKSIVDLTEAYKTAFDPLFATSLITNIPEVMLSLYFAVFQSPEFYLGSRYMKVEYFLVMELFLVTCAPAISAGQLTTQTDKIKCTLHEKLMDVMGLFRFISALVVVFKYARKVCEIERFIRYVEARGCKFRVYKVIPLDAGLLSMMFSFCATYLIVIIQFTNGNRNSI